jgi:hypothetical protein
VSYTASIVLKAAAGYKFTGAITPTTGGAGTPSAGTIHGGDAAENTVSFTVSFPATEPVPNTGIPIGDPSVGLFLDGGSTPRAHNGTTTIAVGTGAFAVSIAPGAYASIVWYLNGTKAAEGPEKTSISLSRWTAKSYLVTVEAQPLGGEKNSGAHTFVVQ